MLQHCDTIPIQTPVVLPVRMQTPVVKLVPIPILTLILTLTPILIQITNTNCTYQVLILIRTTLLNISTEFDTNNSPDTNADNADTNITNANTQLHTNISTNNMLIQLALILIQ